MIATARIAAAAQIIPSYLPGGASVIHGWANASIPKRHLDQFIRFLGAHWLARQTHRPRYVTTSVVIARTSCHVGNSWWTRPDDNCKNSRSCLWVRYILVASLGESGHPSTNAPRRSCSFSSRRLWWRGYYPHSGLVPRCKRLAFLAFFIAFNSCELLKQSH